MPTPDLFNAGESVGQGWIAKPENSYRRDKFVGFVAKGGVRSYSISNVTEFRAKIAELASGATGPVAVDEFWNTVIPTRDIPNTKDPEFLRGFIAGCIGRKLMDSLPA
jgi:hypothetical protein